MAGKPPSPKPPSPIVRNVDFLKTKIMQPALTSNFECHFVIPQNVKDRLKDNGVPNDPNSIDDLKILCSEASLPGSSLATHELNNDFTGVTQRHVYRRLYDDRSDFTFYVNRSYYSIKVFEIWMRYITGEQVSFGENTNVSYRNNYPKNYKTSIYITKFERDYGAKKSPNNSKLIYTFVNAFPISINSMPVSYDSSQLLKVTVSFSYDRYFVDQPKDKAPTQSSVPGVPNVGNNSNYWNSNQTFNNPEFSVGNVSDLNLSGANALNSNVAPNQKNQQTNLGVGANDLAGTASNFA
jgi:hypothetical protein